VSSPAPTPIAGRQPEAAAGSAGHPALHLQQIVAGYGDTTVLRSVTLKVPTGAVVALLGPNGAGKTTLLRTAAGTLRPTGGTVSVFGNDVTRQPAHRRARRGLCLIPEGRGIFPRLTVAENLRVHVPPWGGDVDPVERAVQAFPDLAKRMNQLAGSMSGGQQQMLALSRAYVARPPLVLLDEVSVGLAPRVVDEIFDALRTLSASGVALLIVEQYVTRALAIADQVYLLDKGEVSFSGRPSELDQDALLAGYFGLAPEVT
jgi:branched-chain amino acid transport system ATP-binding protein